MYILTNAIRNVTRAKGRNILIGTIILLISFSICIGLCIRQSATNAETSALEDLTITAQISPDREAAMREGRPDSDENGEPGTFDKEKMREAMKESLTLEQLQAYAEAESVKSFYYTYTLGMNASGNLESYSMTGKSDSSGEDSFRPEQPGNQNASDFSVVGYSSDDAMTDFTDGTSKITDGKMFEEGTESLTCVISNELAEYNNLKTGDKIKLVNPDNEEDAYSLKISGIYENTQSSAIGGGMEQGGPMGRATNADPANCIYMSSKAVEKIQSASKEKDSDSAMTAALSGTYVIGDMDSYESFCDEVNALGLEDGYKVSSSDLNAYEQRLSPIKNLAKYARYFLILIIVIGVVVLSVLNIFSTRERKYEIGVLTAIGMKKGKVAAIFVCEILLIAILGTVVGGGIGAAASVPVTNALLASQMEASQDRMDGRNAAFGREFQGEQPPEMSGEEKQAPSGEEVEKPERNEFLSDMVSAVNIKVLLEVLMLCVFLAVVSGLASAFLIMRSEPLEILSEHD